MPTFRKKPVEIEARELTISTFAEIADWCGGRHQCTWLAPEDQIVRVYTLEGEVTARVGDWIIRGVKGEFYPCRGDIFEATYEPAEGVAS